MGKLDIPNVCQKGGRTYYRSKVAGRDFYLRLPHPEHPDFAAALAQARSPGPQRERPASGTMAALVREFRGSAEFRNVRSPKTRENVERYLGIIETDHGREAVRALNRRDVLLLRDRFAETPGKANNWLNILRRLMSFAVDRGLRKENPAAGIKPLELGEHAPWPAEVLERALKAATPMTRLVIVSALCSGARAGDLIRMQHGWLKTDPTRHDGLEMSFVASKNDTAVTVPVHPVWMVELGKVPRRAVTLLYDRSGKPFDDPDELQDRVRELMKKIGAPTYVSNGKRRGYAVHGLRKNACCYLAEQGLNDSQIGAIVAMTPQTVRHYTKQARALMIARGAAEQVARGDVLPFTGGRRQEGAQ